MSDEKIELVHRTKSSVDNYGEEVYSGLPYTGNSALGSGEMMKRAGERVSYTALPTPGATRPSSSGIFWIVVVQLITQTLLAILIFLFILVFVNQRAFNVTERRPHYQLANGTEARLPQRNWYPLQSDITTIISGLFNLLGKCYAAWIATMTWNYAFLLLERNGMQLKSLSSMISLPVIPALFPPAGFETAPAESLPPAGGLPPDYGRARKLRAFGIALTMLAVFPASFSPPIATGSISWHASNRNVTNADIIYNIGQQGANYGDNNPWASWCSDVNFRPRYIERASALAVHAWNGVSDTSDSAPICKRVLPSVQNLPVGSSLNNVTVPVFSLESFDWITDASDVSSAQLGFLATNSTPGTQPSSNPMFSPGGVALIPDVLYSSLNLSGNPYQVQPSMIQNKTAVVAVDINYAGDCDPSAVALFGHLPPNVYTFAQKTVWGYTSCYVFAKVTYSAGAANCQGCEVVFPLVVQNPPGVDLTLQPDVATEHAMYLMADVIGQLVSANVTMPTPWDNIETYTKAALVRGYSSAWTVISEMIAFYDYTLPSTYVTIPITTSQAFVDRRRLWGWFALQILAFVGGVIFLVHIRSADRYPITNPLMHGLMLDLNMPERSRELARRHLETWADDYQETFITWERGSATSALTIQGDLKRAKDPLYRRVLSHCFGCMKSTAATADSSV